MEYLDFEKPIQELELQVAKARQIAEESNIDMNKTIRELEKQIKATRKATYEGLTSWQRVQLSRHPQRPYTLAYINAMTNGGLF
jgi:acetyl-CoA carboxylase carboxyl transferase subunit alpha